MVDVQKRSRSSSGFVDTGKQPGGGVKTVVSAPAGGVPPWFACRMSSSATAGSGGDVGSGIEAAVASAVTAATCILPPERGNGQMAAPL